MNKHQKSNDPHQLTETLIQMLQLSDKDIAEGKVISQEKSDKYDLDWLQELDKRYNDHVNGVGKTYTWEETVAMAKQALADRRK